MADLTQNAQPYIPIVQQAAQANNVPASLLLGLLAQESAFNPKAVSSAGAQGIAQFMPGTAKEYGIDPFNPNQAINAAAQYLSKGLQKYNGDQLKTLAAYNSGFGNVDKYNGVPPFKETIGHGQGALQYAQQFANMVGEQPMEQPSLAPMQGGAPGLTELLQQMGGTQAPPLQIDPRSLLPQQAPGMGKGLNTLLTVLGTIGNLSGNAANVVGSFKGNPGMGNGSIQASNSILEMLAREKQGQAEYQQMAQIVNDPNMPDNVKSSILMGGKEAVAKQLLAQSAPVDKLGTLEKTIDVYNKTPQGRLEAANLSLQQKINEQNAMLPGELQKIGSVETYKDKLKTERELKDIKRIQELSTKPLKSEADKIEQQTLEAKLGIKDAKPSAEVAKGTTLVTEGLGKVEELRTLVVEGDKLLGGLTLGLTNRSSQWLREDLTDRIGRLRSGGAINKDEEARFMSFIPGPLDSMTLRQQKLDALSQEFRSLATNLGWQDPKLSNSGLSVEAPADINMSTGTPAGLVQGADGVWRAKK